MLYRTEIHFIKRGHQLFKLSDEMCFKSKNLYNYANFLVRQQFFHLDAFLPYDGKEDNLYFQVKGHETYKTLPAQTAQQILKKVEDNWHSFFNAIRQWKVTPSKFRSRPRPPRYKGKNGRFPAYFTRQQCKIRDGYIRFPKTKFFLQTRVYEPLHEIRVVPEGNCFKVEVVYEHHIPELTSREPERVASIDLGLNNLVTLVNNISEQPIVINGKVAKSVNRYYNKERSKLMRNVGERGTSNRLWKLTLKRNHKVGDQMHKASRQVVNWCISHRIDTIVVGKNDTWKQEINLGKRNNQNFVSIPFASLLQKVAYKYEDAGIRYVETDEAYTSKCSSLDGETVGRHETYLGRRVKRGLYRSSDGTFINANVNGAYNILRKVFPEAKSFCGGDRRCALHPVRISIS